MLKAHQFEFDCLCGKRFGPVGLDVAHCPHCRAEFRIFPSIMEAVDYAMRGGQLVRPVMAQKNWWAVAREPPPLNPPAN